MCIDFKLPRTLVLAGAILIVFHEVISHWSDFKAGLRGDYADAARATSSGGR